MAGDGATAESLRRMLRAFIANLVGAARRVFPGSLMMSQAIAFNLFVSFFPILLLALGIVAASSRLSAAVMESLRDLRFILPPGSRQVVMDFLAAQSRKSGTLLTLGIAGTLLTGTQVMTGFLGAFRNIYRDPEIYGYWRDQWRGLCLLLVSFGPLLIASVLTIFGRQLRGWMIHHFGLPDLFNALWLVVYVGLALVSAMLVLALLYRVGLSRRCGWNEVLPGAVVATILWWVVNSAFGYYVRHMPYSAVYGSLAAAIGLIIWMNLIAVVVLFGAAYNAERAARRLRA